MSEAGSQRWDVAVGMEGEDPTIEHAGRKISHQRLRLNVEITEHLVGLPSAEEADDVWVDVGAQKRHGARGAQGPGGYGFRVETVGWAKEARGNSEDVGDVRWGYRIPSIIPKVIGQRGLWGSLV